MLKQYVFRYYNEPGYTELGYNELGYNKLGYNELGYNELGYNEQNKLTLTHMRMVGSNHFIGVFSRL